MPTEQKIRKVDEVREWMETCTVAISADHTGMTVGAMTALRRTLREQGVQFHVVKNSLALLAADAAGRPEMKAIIEGPTGIVFGYEEPTGPVKALSEFIKSTRSPMKIRGGLMGDRVLTADEVEQLAALPSRDELIARILGRMQSPVAGLMNVLNGPISGLARVLQRHIEGAEDQT